MMTVGTTIRVVNEDGDIQDVEVLFSEDGKRVTVDLNRFNDDSKTLTTRSAREMKELLQGLVDFLEACE